MVDKPFVEVGDYRVFSAATNPTDLKWHWDAEDRFICATHDTDWQLQLDNQLPQRLLAHVGVFISAGDYHRLHKGTDDLKLYVLKHTASTATSVQPHILSGVPPQTISQELQYHFDRSIPLDECVFRLGSPAWGRLLREARALYKAGLLTELCENEFYLLESDAGELGSFGGVRVLLEAPFLNHIGKHSVFVRNETGYISQVDISTVTDFVTPES